MKSAATQNAIASPTFSGANAVAPTTSARSWNTPAAIMLIW